MGKIDDDFTEWAKQNLRFPEDFIAEAMSDEEEPSGNELKKKANRIKVEISLKDFADASARAVSTFKSICEFAGVEFNMDPYVRVAALIAMDLFDGIDEEEEE